jgi:hypothetical protein
VDGGTGAGIGLPQNADAGLPCLLEVDGGAALDGGAPWARGAAREGRDASWEGAARERLATRETLRGRGLHAGEGVRREHPDCGTLWQRTRPEVRCGRDLE